MTRIVLGHGIYQVVEDRVCGPGEIIEVPEPWAKRLLDLGHATPYDPDAVQPEPKTKRAVSPKARQRKTRVTVEATE